MKILKKNVLFILLILNMQNSFAAQPVMVNMELVNHTSESEWGNVFDIPYQSGYPALTQKSIGVADFTHGSQESTGNIVFVLSANHSSTFTVESHKNSWPKGDDICAVTVSVIDENQAMLSVTPIKNSTPFTCVFTGDPNKGTASLAIEQTR